MKAKALIAAVPMSAALLAGFPNVASAAFPNFGADTNGPSQTITVLANGAFQISNSGGYAAYPHSYDGSDDTYIGVINNSSAPVTSLAITCSGTCFGFDSDGIDTFGATTNSKDSTGYGGPNAFYTNFATLTSGTVNFITAIAANGGTSYFSLELPLNTNSFTVGAVPLPSSWTMMLMGFAGLGFLSHRARKKTSEGIVTA